MNFSPQNAHDLRIRLPFDQFFRFSAASYFCLHDLLQYRFCRTASLALHTIQYLMGIVALCFSLLIARLCLFAHFSEQNLDLFPVRFALHIMHFFMAVSWVGIVDIGSSVPVVEDASFIRAKIQAIVFGNQA